MTYRTEFTSSLRTGVSYSRFCLTRVQAGRHVCYNVGVHEYLFSLVSVAKMLTRPLRGNPGGSRQPNYSRDQSPEERCEAISEADCVEDGTMADSLGLNFVVALNSRFKIRDPNLGTEARLLPLTTALRLAAKQ